MSDKDIKSPFNACQHREYCRGLSAELTTLGRQEGHDAAMAVHYRKKYEQASAALATKDAEIARLRSQLKGTITRIHTFADNHFGNTPVIDLAEHVVSDLCDYLDELSQPSAQNAI